ncbi:MAG: discoidin domain-containing protein [Luteolibacter sp.]|uniref:discoidin domain-containing protein n=1 Tax=Luteolibacter sp. TaxID=1962973 RepID=UPI0032672A03
MILEFYREAKSACRLILLWVATACVWIPCPAFSQAGGLNAPEAIGAFLNGAFPVTAPGEASPWTTENAFPNLTFVDPLWLTPVPGGNDLLLVGKNGQLWRFPRSASTTQSQVVKVLEWVGNTQSSEDQGFYSIAFHPQFGQAGSPNANYAYVCYNHKPALTGADANHSYWRVSRFTWIPATGTLDPNSEFVLMNQYDRCRWHNGGAMFFDSQGFLNITCGDGGDSGEGGGLTGADGALSRTQKLNFGLFSGLFRIDVDNNSAKSHAIRRQPQSPANKPAGWPASSTQGYGIPNDNPWLDPAGSMLEEYFGLGLRSPHTAHYDAMLGEIWVGDVGEGAREEMTRLVKGGNAQWGYREGSVSGPGTAASPAIGIENPPVVDYSHVTGNCIIGGMRYRGAKWADLLGGKILYGDNGRGRIWTSTLDGSGGAPVTELMVDGFSTGSKSGLANFCTDNEGEIYLMNLNGTNKPGGTIRKLASAGISVEPPQFLSQTGVFANMATLATVPGVIPYSVASPLWSDGAAKRRWIILPNDGVYDTAAEKIVFSKDGSWLFPAGTVFVKHFEVATNENNPSQVKRLETRFLVCTAGGGKYGVTYRWNAAGTDAELLTTGQGEDFSVTNKNGVTEPRHWDYPSRADCMLCHNAASGQALGVRTYPLNGNFYYATTGRTANQLATFNALGMFDQTLTSTDLGNFIEARSMDDPTAPVEHRVRSYFDTNCAHCHQAGGTVDYFDARLATPLISQRMVNQVLEGNFDLGPDGRYLKPGDADLSALHVRLSNVGNGAAMPPLAKNVVDHKAVDFLRNYINGLNPAEFETTSSPQARYVRLTALSEVLGRKWTTVGEFSILRADGTPVPTSDLSVYDYDSQETVDGNSPATMAIDGNPTTYWHTEWGAYEAPLPHHLTIDIGSLRKIGGFVYTPRQGNQNGRIANYQVHYSVDGINWTPMKSGTWPNDTAVQRYDGLVGKRKARCEIAGPVARVGGPFDVTVAFDTNVTDFVAADLNVTGGSVGKIRGAGYYYVATILPTSPVVAVSVPADVANAAGIGSRASAALSVSYVDSLPPVPEFTDVPSQVSGPFQIGLSFNEHVNGLSASDFSLMNATLTSIVPVGNGYVLNLVPTTQGSSVGIELIGGSVTDNAGIRMGNGISASTLYQPQVLGRNASEASYIGGGMALVTDAAAPHGQYLWLPDGAYPANGGTPIPVQNRVEFTFVVPTTGPWMMRGMIRAPDATGDSFWVEVDGNQATGTVNLWNLSPVGSTYAWDYVNNRNVADPVIVNLTAGTHVITVFAREDGARLDRFELVSVKPIPTLTTTRSVVDGSFVASLAFTADVTGLTGGDFQIAGGSVVSVAGSGSFYNVTILPTSGTVSLSLPANTVSGTTGSGNLVSNSLSVTYRNFYQQWAFDHGVSGANAFQLADEDGDGIAKLLEFAFNLDPTRPDCASYDPSSTPGSGLPRMMVSDSSTGHSLSLQYLRRKSVPGLSYKAQFGQSLNNFTDASGLGLIESVDADWERVTIDDPAGSGPVARFGRVVVIYGPP